MDKEVQKKKRRKQKKEAQRAWAACAACTDTVATARPLAPIALITTAQIDLSDGPEPHLQRAMVLPLWRLTVAKGLNRSPLSFASILCFRIDTSLRSDATEGATWLKFSQGL